MKKIYLLLFCLLSSSLLFSQQKTVSGTVTDEEGVGLSGVTILVKGTQIGTLSDDAGKFSIDVPQGQNTLVVSFTTFETQEIDVSSRSTVSVSLQSATLEEVVVVGYAVQQKVNVTGSVEVVEASEITRQPVFQTSQALAGLVPGLTAVQSSGQPGSDGATLRIRGIGTLGNGNKNNPLILIDGIPDDINGIDPSDIKSVSVLKDASAAAIYGSRAANGVILITTHRGAAGTIKTTYNNYFGIQRIAQNLKFMDAVGFMEAFNSAEPGAFSQEDIDDYKSGVDVGTDKRPDTDWVDLLFSDNGFQQYHNVSVRGGTENAKIAASVSFMDQAGNIPNFDFDRYNGRFNTDLKVSKTLDLAFDLNFRREIQNAPADLSALTRQAYRIQPLFQAINDDGSWGPGWNGGNPIANINAGGRRQRTTNYFRGLLKATYTPIKDFSIAVTYAPQYLDRDRDNYNATWEWKINSNAPPEPLILNQRSLYRETFTSFQHNFNAIARYSKDFGNHSISALAGYEFLRFDSEIWSASRNSFVLQEFTQLNNGDANTQLNGGSATLNGLESVFGRINYVFDNKYLFEANVRRDASSRFAPDYRTAIFPSFSVGWRISQEDFFPTGNFLTDLKLRASWGQLGNQFIFDGSGNPVNFAYTSLFGVGNANPIIGGIPIVGGAQTVLANSALQWETGETSNVAVDGSLLNGRLTFTAEYYVRTTKDILLGVTIPTSVGFEPPVQNAGEVQNRGYDLSLGWKDNIGDFKYGFNANFADFVNEITDLGGLDELPPGNTINRLGESVGAIFGLEVLGLYQESDFSNGSLNEGLPTSGFGPVQPGDLKYADLNEDGILNNDDRTIIGSNISTKNWGFDVFAEYKGFDLTASLLGVGGRDVTLLNDAAYPFFNAGKIQEWHADYWTPQNTDASLPRLTPGSSHANWRTNETWTFDASYIRLRNVTLGYAIPQSVLQRIGIGSLRIFVSGQNLLTFDNMPDGIDPLIPNFNGGSFYPVTTVYTSGLSVTF